MRKTCTRCHRDLPAEAFRRLEQPWCRECFNAYNRAWRAEHQDAVRQYNAEYASEHAEEIRLRRLVRDGFDAAEATAKIASEAQARSEQAKRLAEIAEAIGARRAAKTIEKKERQKKARAKWLAKNPDKALEWARADYARHAESRKAKVREYQKTERGRLVKRLVENKRRMASTSHVSVEYVAKLLESFDNRCAWCRVNPAEHMDHITPHARDGKHEEGNLVPACRKCNQSKGAMAPEAWAARIGADLSFIRELSRLAA